MLISWQRQLRNGSLQLEDYPRVLMALFIEKPTPFVDMFLDNIAKLAYPKAKIDLFIHNTVSAAIKVTSDKWYLIMK